MTSSSHIRYINNHFGDASESQISKLEHSIGFCLPTDYKDFLLRENGGIPNEEGDENFKVMFGIYDGPNDLELNWDDSRSEIPKHLLPIGENLNQDFILLDLNDGSIHIDGSKLSSGIEEFTRKYFSPCSDSSDPTDLIDDMKFDILARMLDSGELAVDTEAMAGMSLVQYSSWLGKTEAVEFLAKYKPNTKGALHSTLKGFTNRVIIKTLLDLGADVNELNEKGQSVLEVDSPWIKHIVELKEHCSGN
ncbi:SMI1/KNR4 family protein [Rubritalea sp.]|uniref:SMI1/KNR4 family protein n=1 Tax=Rubritalea sp. TaxID=2109375 RepID=UPI003EF3F492